MKILAINGSHRGERGHTAYLIEKLFKGAASAGADCESVVLAKRKINRCLACAQCQIKEHPLECVYQEKDDVAQIFEKMAAADLLILATPVYVLNMSGLMKTFLDRLYATGNSSELTVTQSGLLFHRITPEISSKPFVPLICCDNLEADTPQTLIVYFNSYARFMDAPQVGRLVRNSGRLFGHGKDPSAANRFPRIKAVYRAYEDAGRELVKYGRILPRTQRRAAQEIIPIPFFGLLKRLPLRSLKEKFVIKAGEMIS